MKKVVICFSFLFFLFIPSVLAGSYYEVEDGSYMLCEDYAPGSSGNCFSINRDAPGFAINTRNKVIMYNNQEYRYNENLQEEYNKTLNGISRMYYYLDNNKYVLCETKNSCKRYSYEQLEKLGAIIYNNDRIVLSGNEGPGAEDIYYYNPSQNVTDIPSGPGGDSENNGQTDIPSKVEPEPTTDTCTRLKEPLQFIGKIVRIVKILIPIVIIVLGVIDFFKAILGSKDDEIKKSARSLLMRTIAGVVIFFIPTIISVVFSLISDFGNLQGDFNACQKCIFRVDQCK